MKLIVHGKNLQVTPALYEYAERKLGPLGSWFDETCELHAALSVQGHKLQHVVEVTVACHGLTLRAEERREDMYASLDLVADKLERKIRKLREKLRYRVRHQGGLKDLAVVSGTQEPEKEPFEVARVKTVTVKPVDIEEAILQMNLLDHNFHLFFNRDSNKTELVYRRNDGSYGLITTT